nr:AAA family ATPase [Cupriavidus alkaliphilus]
MHINSIQIQNYRCYTDFTAQFQPGVNVVAGVNGSGKTSLLKALRESFTGLLSFFQLRSASIQPLQDADVRIDVTSPGTHRYRFEPQYPARVTTNAIVLDGNCQWSVKRTSQTRGVEWEGEMPGQRWNLLTGQDSVFASGEAPVLPILAFYPAYRQWPSIEINELSAVTQKESRTDGYRSWWDASSEVLAFQQWVIAKSIERLQRATEQEVPWDVANDDELGIVNGAIGRVVEGARGIRYDVARKALIVEWADLRVPTLFDNLSDGQRVAIALVADIARRMCLLNPHLGMDVAEDTNGVVLIDELDVHLHPKWQRMMVQGLARAFPRVQFIVSSHSPQVLSELKPEQIILLTTEGAIHPVASYGLDSSRVLEQIMGAPARPSEVQRRLDELFLAIERNELEHGNAMLKQLKGTAPDLPELAQAEALIKRKQVLGR